MELELQRDDEDAGGLFGLGLCLGWDFTPRVDLHPSSDIAVAETDFRGESLTHVNLMGRFSFPTPQRWEGIIEGVVPYVEAGIGRQRVREQNYPHPGSGERGELSAHGPTYSLGAGVLMFVSRSFAADYYVRYSVGEFTSVEFNGATDPALDVGGRPLRAGFGFAWYPMASRDGR